MQTDPLKQLVYTSTAMIEPRVILTPVFIEQLQERNRQLGITGTLAWRKNQFMQIIEGPSSAINRLFGAILRDPKHRNIVLVSERIIAEREFPNWDMTVFEITSREFKASFVPDNFRRRGSRILDAFRRGVWA